MPETATASPVRQVDDAGFAAEVLAAAAAAGRPVLVDFFAGWCGPCHAIAPSLEAIASERAGELDVLKLDVDANPETTARFAIKSLPTLILFRAGEPVARQSGALPKARLRAWLDQSLSLSA
jgi:thioredoxin 1